MTMPTLLSEENPEALLADGLDLAYIGVCQRFGQPPVAAYDYDKVIEILMTRDGMTYEEAVEFFDFNIIGGWHGENTPVYIQRESQDGEPTDQASRPIEANDLPSDAYLG